MKKGYKCILAIVNNGFSEQAMDTAKACGAKGGTILQGRGTISKDAEKFFNISISPEKEIVMILVPVGIKEDVLHALYKSVGLNTPGQGIAFSMPVDNVIGLTDFSTEQTNVDKV